MWPPHSFLNPQSLEIALLLLLTLTPSHADAALTNTTIDDTSSSFSWSGNWNAITPTDPCGGCSAKPDPTQTEGGTWHDVGIMTTKDETATGSFTFQGSAVYIYGIDQANSQADIAFMLDSLTATHHYTGSDRFAYRALFFSATELASGQTHTVNWALQKSSASDRDLQEAIFDYTVVTSGTADTTGNPSSGSTTGAPSGTGSDSNSGSTSDSNSGSTSNSNSGSTSGSNSGSTSNSNSGSTSGSNSNSGSSGSSGGDSTSGGKSNDTSSGTSSASNNSDTGKSSSSKPSSTGSATGTHATKSGPSSAQVTGAQNSTSSTTNNGGTDGASGPNQQPSSPGGAAAVPTKSKPNVGAIVGATVGALAVGILATVCFCTWHRRRQRRGTTGGAAMRRAYPFVAEPPPVDITAAAAPARLSEKTLDPTMWNSAGQPAVPTPLQNGTQRTEMAQSESAASAYTSTSAPPTDRERMLEERLAELEARIAAPPPYATP
ncbi:hypothetical protein MVEN_01310300 [Mycena venus]|uniref:Uncharacterized protein n=1 Tax=Mycena venus TaxID=2733690 RepID=A0A8H6Y0D4_9AGAR|nr:hypothetical protein MVEN_01310300 [Mycena venus]